jgi:phage FluMu protein Com
MFCPACAKMFKNVIIEDGQVKCPSCREVMFQYREPGERLTPAQFMGLMESRGLQCAKKARRWMRGPFAVPFIAFIWPHLATTFEEYDGS